MSKSNMILYGAGKLGRRAVRVIPRIYPYHLTAVADKAVHLTTGEIMGIPVIAPEDITAMDYDVVLIAVSKEEDIVQIKQDLRNLGIPESKIEILKESEKYKAVWMDMRVDWTRNFADFERAAGLKGSVAECGVFRGDFSKYLNRFFYDRTLYLFDTFEGFDERDILREQSFREKKFLESKFNENGFFKNTAVETVMNKMLHPERVSIRKGWFPQSAEGINDRFCFVMLDMDLYQPMIAGLRFFWDKMEEGGAILCHDYFHDSLTGVRQAVAEFEKELGVRIVKSPIGDDCSIALYK